MQLQKFVKSSKEFQFFELDNEVASISTSLMRNVVEPVTIIDEHLFQY